MEDEVLNPVVLFDTPEVCDTCASGYETLEAVTQTERKGNMQRERLAGYHCTACGTTHLYA